MPVFRHSVCNEIFKGLSFGESAKAIRKAGYSGVEIAPFTLSECPASLEPARRRECRDILGSEGLAFAGMHWLLAAPQGLHVTTSNAALRASSWDYLRSIIDLCADLGGGPLVFGSPKQRSSTGGLTATQATANLIDGLASVADHAAGQGCCVLLEPLSPDQTDVVTTLGQAAAIVRQIGNPGVQLVFDTHNAVVETEPHDTLLDRHYDMVRHVHVNEMDGRRPGLGAYDFRPVLRVLQQRGYAGWVSLEAFSVQGDAVEDAAASLRYLENLLQ
jgi:sugar phosphate isomerase/epimerase